MKKIFRHKDYLSLIHLEIRFEFDLEFENFEKKKIFNHLSSSFLSVIRTSSISH